MPTTISIAMSKEVGTPQCESLGVTCSLEFDDDSPTFPLETFQRAFHSAVLVCQECLREESARQA